MLAQIRAAIGRKCLGRSFEFWVLGFGSFEFWVLGFELKNHKKCYSDLVEGRMKVLNITKWFDGLTMTMLAIYDFLLVH